MTSKLKFFCFVVLINTGCSSNLFSQLKTSDLPNSIKTAAIYSSNKSFFTDYPIDSVVSNLNSLNTNKKIKYCKKTEDNSRSGLQADYIIDIDIYTKKGIYVESTYETVARPTTYNSIQDTGTNALPNIRIEQGSIQTSPGYYKPYQYAMNVILITNNNGKKKNRKIFTAEDGMPSLWFNSNLEFSNQIPLIIELETYLLAYFSK